MIVTTKKINRSLYQNFAFVNDVTSINERQSPPDLMVRDQNTQATLFQPLDQFFGCFCLDRVKSTEGLI